MKTIITDAEIFALANQIKKEQGLTQKEAYAQAKEQLSKDAIVITNGQIVSHAAKLRKEQELTQKEAYALAKAQLLAQAANVVETPANVVPAANMELHSQLVEKMTAGNVKFTFLNAKGREITTTGTLVKSHIPTNRVVQGRKTAKNENTQVFYDVRHGVYRSYQKDQLVAIH